MPPNSHRDAPRPVRHHIHIPEKLKPHHIVVLGLIALLVNKALTPLENISNYASEKVAYFLTKMASFSKYAIPEVQLMAKAIEGIIKWDKTVVDAIGHLIHHRFTVVDVLLDVAKIAVVDFERLLEDFLNYPKYCAELHTTMQVMQFMLRSLFTPIVCPLAQRAAPDPFLRRITAWTAVLTFPPKTGLEGCPRQVFQPGCVLVYGVPASIAILQLLVLWAFYALVFIGIIAVFYYEVCPSLIRRIIGFAMHGVACPNHTNIDGAV